MHRPRKRFGQHFLHDKDVIQRLVNIINPLDTQHLVEIGPGQGALTLPILKKTTYLDVVEIDRDLIPQLKSRCHEKGELIVHQADALTFDFSALIKNNLPLRLIGNLPYNIATQLIFHLLDYGTVIQDMHFMLQKEVVDRLAAHAGDAAYGRLSIMVQYACEVIALFDVPPSAFFPPPQVYSSIVRLMPFATKPYVAENITHFATLVKLAFSQRRKTLRNCLKSMVADADWITLNMDSTLRPEQLSVEDYVNLSNRLLALRK